MRKLIIVASAALALCGCATPDSVRRQALNNCESVGITEEDPQFATCSQAYARPSRGQLSTVTRVFLRACPSMPSAALCIRTAIRTAAGISKKASRDGVPPGRSTGDGTHKTMIIGFALLALGLCHPGSVQRLAAANCQAVGISQSDPHSRPAPMPIRGRIWKPVGR